MRRISILLAAIALAVASFAPVAMAAGHAPGPNAGPGNCAYGETHADFGRSGFTGQGHKPGIAHRGAAGFCGLGVFD